MSKMARWLVKRSLAVTLILMVMMVFSLSSAIPIMATGSVTPNGAGVLPANGSTINGSMVLTFDFNSSSGVISELQLDMYLGDDAGVNSSDFGSISNCAQFNFPANEVLIDAWIDQTNLSFMSHTRAEVVTSVGENSVRLLEAAGFEFGTDCASTVKSNINYASSGSQGNWSIVLDFYKLKTDALEILVMVKDSTGAEWGQNDYSINNGANTKAYWYALTESAVEPTGSGITPLSGTTIYGSTTLVFPFKSTHGDLEGLDVDFYFGNNTGAGRDENLTINMDLPAIAIEIEGVLDIVNGYFMTNTRDDLVTLFGGGTKGEYSVRAYEAIGFIVGQDCAAVAKQNVRYEGTDSEGVWTFTMDATKLQENALELLVTVTNEDGMQWGNNDFKYYGDQTQVYYYTIEDEQVPSTRSVGGEVARINRSFVTMGWLALAGLVLAGGVLAFFAKKGLNLR